MGRDSSRYPLSILCLPKLKKSRSSCGNQREWEKQKVLGLSKRLLFLPIGIETYGSWGTEGLKLIKTIGIKLKEVTGERKSTFFFHTKYLHSHSERKCKLCNGHSPPIRRSGWNFWIPHYSTAVKKTFIPNGRCFLI